MPTAQLKALAKQAGKSIEDAERYWQEAKKQARAENRYESDDDFYPYVVGIVKKRLKLEHANTLTYVVSNLVAETAANWMYHGTPFTFDEFRVDQSNTMLDRAIGVHFAADSAISQRFMDGLYQEKQQPTTPGRLLKIKAPPRSKIRIVKQPRYASGGRESDQHAIGAFVSATVFDAQRSLFVEWVTKTRGINEELANEIYNLLKNKQAPADKRFKLAASKNRNSFRSYVSNFDAGLHGAGAEFKRRVVREFDYLMMRQGIDALVYANTSPRETRDDNGVLIARSLKSYIVLTHALSRYLPQVETASALSEALKSIAADLKDGASVDEALSDAADEYKLNPQLLMRKFKEQYGVDPSEYTAQESQRAQAREVNKVGARKDAQEAAEKYILRNKLRLTEAGKQYLGRPFHYNGKDYVFITVINNKLIAVDYQDNHYQFNTAATHKILADMHKETASLHSTIERLVEAVGDNNW